MNYFKSLKKCTCPFVLLCVVLLSGCASTATLDSQTGDAQWIPKVSDPEFSHGQGPVVLVDAGHGNFHTIGGRYSAFADLLKRDGFRVQGAEGLTTPQLLEQADIYVVSNAIFGGDNAEWKLPVPSAFTTNEIATIAEWVDDGGSLLLIADHMPFPGATEKLANEFGVVFYNGFAMKSASEGGTLSFTRSSGSLAHHPITLGRSDSESIESVTSFTGQAFRFVADLQPLMYMPDDWIVLMPIEAWSFDESTPTISARGLVQGGVMHRGKGRVAIFGEAAMFTAQTSIRSGVVRQMGMNHPDAAENAQFVLNLMRWLSGRLSD